MSPRTYRFPGACPRGATTDAMAVRRRPTWGAGTSPGRLGLGPEAIRPVLWALFFLIPVGRAEASQGLPADEIEGVLHWAAALAERAPFELGAAVVGARGSPLAALGGLGQLAAAAAFVVNMWTRVRMPGGVAPPPPSSLR